jgi:hypothetical protein
MTSIPDYVAEALILGQFDPGFEQMSDHVSQIIDKQIQEHTAQGNSRRPLPNTPQMASILDYSSQDQDQDQDQTNPPLNIDHSSQKQANSASNHHMTATPKQLTPQNHGRYKTGQFVGSNLSKCRRRMQNQLNKTQLPKQQDIDLFYQLTNGEGDQWINNKLKQVREKLEQQSDDNSDTSNTSTQLSQENDLEQRTNELQTQLQQSQTELQQSQTELQQVQKQLHYTTNQVTTLQAELQESTTRARNLALWIRAAHDSATLLGQVFTFYPNSPRNYVTKFQEAYQQIHQQIIAVLGPAQTTMLFDFGSSKYEEAQQSRQ